MLVLTRDPVADRIGSVVTALCTRTVRGVLSELALGVTDGMPEPCVVIFDNLHTIDRKNFRSRITQLSAGRMDEVCNTLARSLGCV